MNLILQKHYTNQIFLIVKSFLKTELRTRVHAFAPKFKFRIRNVSLAFIFVSIWLVVTFLFLMSVDRVFLSYETRLLGAHVSTTERLWATTAPIPWWSLLQPLSVMPILISHTMGSGLYLNLLKITDSGFLRNNYYCTYYFYVNVSFSVF